MGLRRRRRRRRWRGMKSYEFQLLADRRKRGMMDLVVHIVDYVCMGVEIQ